MKARYSYYNTSMLVLHDYNLKQKSLYELFILRDKILSNDKFIIEKINKETVEIINKIIINKPNGSEMLNIITENINIANNNNNNNNNNNFELLKLYKNINRLEEIFEFKKDYLLTNNQIKNRANLYWEKLFNGIKEKILLCKW